MDLEKIGKFIKEQRQAKELTQKQIADNFGITAKAVSKWECGQNAPDIAFIDELSKILDVTISEILNGCKNETQREIDIKANKVIEEKRNNTKKLRIKTIVEIFLLILVITATSIAVFFGSYYNKYHGTCQIYKIYSQSTEFELQGYLMQTNKDLTLLLNDLKYVGKSEIKLSSYETSINIGNNTIYRTNFSITDKENQRGSNSKIEQVDANSKYELEKLSIVMNVEYFNSKNKKESNKIILKKEKYYSN